MTKPVPVEPPVEMICGQCGIGPVVSKKEYDALQSALQTESYLHKLDHSLADQWLKRAEQAESRNKRLVELLREAKLQVGSLFSMKLTDEINELLREVDK